MNGETTFRNKMGARDFALFCTFSTTRFRWVSCLVNLELFKALWACDMRPASADLGADTGYWVWQMLSATPSVPS